MSINHVPISSHQHARVETQRIKTLKVIGEAVGQLVLENKADIDAIKIIKVDAELRDTTDHLFKNKVVKQGVIHKQILYVDPYDVVRHASEDVPFMLTVDIPGVEPNPFTEVQNHLLDLEVDFTLKPACHDKKGEIIQKTVAHILVRVSEWALVDVVTKHDIFPKISHSKGYKSFVKCYNR
ncbi:MAG TPA: DUF3794 domain-containing protein [Bacillota bacterium]|nr:DUF3794 domain-containing protein [Bacillota bacterium]